ncbi:MAG TPA: LysM peptidoglycan-binding domain-containing protein [Solirubrobacterales bacterium]|nr:LysM peptidoglycan-binding domain-containing protein [Solirubrobacterales bacterium]
MTARIPFTALVATLALTVAPAAAGAAVTHTIQPGETLSGIAAANGLTTDALASWNGVSSDYLLIAGASLSVPTPEEAGLGTTATATTDPASTDPASTAVAPAPWLGSIPSPWGDLYLDAGAAAAWNAMREASLSTYGVDLYPAGPLSAYRSSTQQGEMYELYLSGVGAPANPPGYSSHEYGVSVDLATPAMRDIVDQIGWQYGWGKFEAPDEWWHVSWGG